VPRQGACRGCVQPARFRDILSIPVACTVRLSARDRLLQFLFSHSLRGLSAIRPLRARTDSTFRLDSDSIGDGVADPLLAAKVSFGCLHRYMAKQKLDLV
jgi:hypothetical protein